MIERAGLIALAWLATVVFWYAVALIKNRGVSSFHEACELWGLCFWWPATLALELALAWEMRRARNDRAAGQAAPEKREA